MQKSSLTAAFVKGVVADVTGNDITTAEAKSLATRIQHIINRADQARSAGTKYAYAACGELGLDVSAIHNGPTKEAERLLQKCFARYAGKLEDVPDVARLQVRVDTTDQLLKVRKMFSGQASAFTDLWNDKGVTFQECDDTTAIPTNTGYRAISCKYEVDLGKGRTQKLEIQFIHKDWAPAYETSHVYLEHIRDLKDNAKAQSRDLTKDETKIVGRYEFAARELHADAHARTGADVLLASVPARATRRDLKMA